MNKKVKYLIAALLMSTGYSYAQKTTVSVDIEGLKDKQVMIAYTVGETRKTDTVAINDGKFTWVADMPEPQKVYMMFPTRMMEFFAESGNIQIKGKADALRDSKVSGSRTQDESEAFTKSLKDLSDQESPLYQKYGKVSPEEQIALEAKLNDLRMEKRARAKSYITKNPKSVFSLSLVAERATMGEYNDVKSIYDLLDPSTKKSNQGKLLTERLAVLKRSAIGEQVLDFTQNNTENKPVKFSEFKGKYVLIDFWASWCGPCRAENPNVLKAYNQYKDKGFTVVGVSLDDKAENWKKAIEEDKMPWTQLSDLKGFENEVSSYYGIRGIPSTLLIDPQGKIIAKDLRGTALDKKLAEIFN